MLRCSFVLGLVVIVLLLGSFIAVAQDTPNRSGTLLWPDYVDPAHLDIYSEFGLAVSDVIAGLYSDILKWRYEGPLKVSPDLAECWDALAVNGDLFPLIEGLQWHDGDPFTSADSLNSLKQIINPEKCSPRYVSLIRSSINDATAPYNFTFEVKLRFPTPIFPTASAWRQVYRNRFWNEMEV